MKLEDLRKLAEARTKGEWTGGGLTLSMPTSEVSSLHIGGFRGKDSNFIATFANHAEALLDVVEAAKHFIRTGMDDAEVDLDIAIAKLENIK